MPRISQFFGTVITLYYNDHAPPHFHALYADAELLIELSWLDAYAGEFPRRAHALVLEWATIHREALTANWERARLGLPLDPIPPLE